MKSSSYFTVIMRLFRALAQFWNPAYSCFTFGKVDLVPTVVEYTTLLRCPKIQADKAYSRVANVPTFLKKLMSITTMSEQWVATRIKQKGDSKCIPWKSLLDLILTHLDTKKKVIFPKALGHVDKAVLDLFDRLDKMVTLVPTILVETFRSLNACQRASEGRFIGCTQILLAWFHSHFWKVEKVYYRVFSENYSPLEELVATSRRDDISKEKWIVILQNPQDEDVEWRAP
ncbi:6-phosphofructo-2-kinase/fructose-2,6-bisphosphatase-like protein [Gossypium australe]|uniref:6-phosphofructo-2-kinase/fructose-2, 6-bisphosphatase-like protein n=1 Tax=Gossypium australe TaxID=47621 RepID=A0A5B6UW03_9ROSI|nr:6-phosphofructo-2-kinase/fructose-2,6-bisphosphatase-like protein [Gossypium australe]